MFIDSHCHLNFPELTEKLDEVLFNMKQNRVTHALCVSVELPKVAEILKLVEQHENLYASVGVHPDYELSDEPTEADIVTLAQHSKVVAIGETGLDYYRLHGDLEWQRSRFRTHIRAAKTCKKPLIVHTRAAAEDTLRIMQEENASEVGGVMHCFTETLDVAHTAIDMGFYISFSGIVTFKNATQIKQVAASIPLNRILIETDAPYLAPVPHRGKLNQPGFVINVAKEISSLRNIPIEEVGEATSFNFCKLFLKENLEHGQNDTANHTY